MDLEISPVDLEVSPVDLEVLPVDLEVSPVDLGVLLVGLEVSPVDLGGLPVDLEVSPVDEELKLAMVDMSFFRWTWSFSRWSRSHRVYWITGLENLRQRPNKLILYYVLSLYVKNCV